MSKTIVHTPEDFSWYNKETSPLKKITVTRLQYYLISLNLSEHLKQNKDE